MENIYSVCATYVQVDEEYVVDINQTINQREGSPSPSHQLYEDPDDFRMYGRNVEMIIDIYQKSDADLCGETRFKNSGNNHLHIKWPVLLTSLVLFVTIVNLSAVLLKEQSEVETYWHIHIAGINGSTYLKSVELYNWQTRKQCAIEEIPEGLGGHSGVLMNGNPLVCGGSVNNVSLTKCYHYQRRTKNWTETSSLMVGTSNSGSVPRPGIGWFLFGGNQLLNSQKLAKIDSKWEVGPKVPVPNVFGQCIVQISDDVTAFIGGDKTRKRIYTYDWSKPKPKLVPVMENLNVERYFSTCGQMQGTDGQMVVVIIGGFGKGMEVWNPIESQVVTLANETPPEKEISGNLLLATMITIKGGSEFIFYGGRSQKISSNGGIWRYVLSKNLWIKIGNFLTPRYAHVSLPIYNVECPS